MSSTAAAPDSDSLNCRSSPAEKIACISSLFHGRIDVFPQRFESKKTGRAAYSPACSNEWIRGVCEKPRIKCSNCSHQDWIPVTERSLKWHLSGKDSSGYPFVMGVYPMLLDESCHFLAIDLDGEGWQEDSQALIAVVKKLNLPIVLERSRSGHGGHLWFFFEHSIPAIQARRFGTHLLTEAIELDGSQHLQDEAAWRCDRQKDLLLQRHGYLVMRFLTTDLSKELNTTLDSILATLAHCNRKVLKPSE